MKKEQIIKFWKEAVSSPEWHMSVPEDPMEVFVSPRIYHEIPSFMENPIAWKPEDLKGADVAFLGIPYESNFQLASTNWTNCPPEHPDPDAIIGRSGSDQSPAHIRQYSVHFSVRLNGGYCPEVGEDFRLVDHLNMMDYGDVDVDRKWDADTMARHAVDKVADIVKAGAVPLVFGGCHEIPYPVMKAISDNTDGKIGLIVFDGHYDNDIGGMLTTGNAFGKIYEDCRVETENMVFIGINGGGGYNTPAMAKLMKDIGITVFQAKDVDALGAEEVAKRAVEIAGKGTKGAYVSLDADVMDVVSFPAQKNVDAFGMSARNVKDALAVISKEVDLVGFDMCTMGPAYDHKGAGAVIATKFYIEILKGLAVRKAGISI